MKKAMFELPCHARLNAIGDYPRRDFPRWIFWRYPELRRRQLRWASETADAMVECESLAANEYPPGFGARRTNDRS